MMPSTPCAGMLIFHPDQEDQVNKQGCKGMEGIGKCYLKNKVK